MSESRKRSRKSKIEIRDTDFEYEVVSDQNDETTPILQRVPQTLQLEYPEIPLAYDHDYCQRGSQSFAQLVPSNSIIRKKRPKIYNTDENIYDNRGRLINEKRPSLLRKMASTSRKGKARINLPKSNRDINAVKLCRYDPQSLLNESTATVANSSYPADKILDVLMRNLWGNVLYTPNVVDSHESLLQLTFELWQVWCHAGKFVRGSPLFYQCHICSLAWWRLQPFRDHIKIHDTKTLKVSLKENIHECMIIASEEPVKRLVFIDIEDDCWKCGQDLEFHKKSTEAYTCSICKKTQYTCASWHSHRTKCMHYYKYLVKDTECSICHMYIDSVDLEKHMVSAHSVRSDEIAPVTVKMCPNCDTKYFTFNMHNCFRSSKNNGCNYCCRKFATKQLANSHMSSPHNKSIACRICRMVLEKNCQEMEHILRKHPNNYCLAYKCTLCPEQCKMFATEESMALHRNNWHQKKADKRRSVYEMMLVPQSSLEKDAVEEPFRFDGEIEPSVKTAKDIHDETETKSIQVLSADIDIIVDEVDIKKEPIYDENGEIDYEEMLNSMFSESTTQDTGVKVKVENVQDDNPNDLINEEFNIGNVVIKTEPTDDIDIIEHPIIVKVKSEPIDYESEEMVDQTENSEENDNKVLNQENKTEVNHSQGMVADNQIENSVIKNENKDIQENETKVNHVIKNENKVLQENETKVKDKTVTVKVEPGINDIKVNIKKISTIKSEDIKRDDDSNIDNLLNNLNNDMDWVADEINPDEITVDVMGSNGLYKKKKLYACSKCGYTAHYKHYTLHVQSGCSVSPGINESYSCSKCGLTFVMFRNYVLHFDGHGYDVMSCPKCGENFDQLVKLLSHVQRHIKSSFVLIHVLNKGGEESTKSNKEFKCQECREVVPNADMFRHWEAHLTLKTEKQEVETSDCQVKEERESPELTVDCERVTMNNKQLESATLKLALEQLQSTLSIDKQCAVCYRVFTRRCDVKRHIVEHLLMDAHVLKVHNKGFRCQICAEVFPRMDIYKFHMREHGSMPIFKCELCDKTFSDSSNFAKHKKTHNVRVMECDLCRKKFHSKLYLQKHIIEHSKGAKIQCVHCPATFTSKQAYKRHKYQHVPHKFKCMLCDLSFTALQHKWDHDWEVHKERKHEADCPICFKSFRKLQDVRTHARIEHMASLKLRIRHFQKLK